MSDTPRTDAAIETEYDQQGHCYCFVPVWFAEDLEREYRQLKSDMQSLIDHCCPKCLESWTKNAAPLVPNGK